MQLSFAMLANSADIGREGNLWIAGADFDSVFCQGVPVVGAPVLIQAALVAKFVISPGELQAEHSFALAFTKPDGERIDLQGPRPLAVVANQLEPAKGSFSTVIARLFIACESLGDYQFHIIGDGEEVKTLALTLRTGQPNIIN